MVLERQKNVNEEKCHKERHKCFSQVMADATTKSSQAGTARVSSHFKQGCNPGMCFLSASGIISDVWSKHNAPNTGSLEVRACFTVNRGAWFNAVHMTWANSTWFTNLNKQSIQGWVGEQVIVKQRVLLNGPFQVNFLQEKNKQTKYNSCTGLKIVLSDTVTSWHQFEKQKPRINKQCHK